MAGSTRSKSLLNDEIYGHFKEAILSAITEILPRIIEEITPVILEKSKSIIEQSAANLFIQARDQENVANNITNNIQQDVENFIYKNQSLWYSKLGKRKDALYKYLRCDKLILLYNDCLEIEPMYIPRKFRNDRVHVMNEKEKNIYKKLALEKMKTEMEILTNRREHFRNNLDETDKGLKHFVGNQNIPEVLKKQVLLEWEKDCQKDVTRLEEVWENKIKGMKESFEKDKVSLERNSEFQTNEDSRENGINKKETNQSRREETRYRQTEQASYNQNQHRESSFNSTGYRPRNHNQNHGSSKNYYRHHYRPRQKQPQRY